MNTKQRQELATLCDELERVQIAVREMAEAEEEKADNLAGAGLDGTESAQLIEETAEVLQGCADGLLEALQELAGLVG